MIPNRTIAKQRVSINDILIVSAVGTLFTDLLMFSTGIFLFSILIYCTILITTIIVATELALGLSTICVAWYRDKVIKEDQSSLKIHFL